VAAEPERLRRRERRGAKTEKKEAVREMLGVLAVPGRLELPTFGLGNRCSIRLSYGTICRRLANPSMAIFQNGERRRSAALVLHAVSLEPS
jgi:hypothetical protein